MNKLQKPKVKLSDFNKSSNAIMKTVAKSLEDAGYPKEKIDEFYREAMVGNYDDVMRTAMRWADID